MDKVIYFDNNDGKRDSCCGRVYYDFLDYAFSKTDYFMLVYVNYCGKGYSNKMRQFRRILEPFRVKSRSNPSWPGTLGTFSPQTTYKIIFYQTSDKAKESLKQVSCLSDWSSPNYPQDLAFFKGNQCWFYSVGHERIGAIIHADETDLDFIEDSGLATRDKAFIDSVRYYDSYDEMLE